MTNLMRRLLFALTGILLACGAALAFSGSVKTLVSTGITTALSAQAQTAITALDGVTAVTLEANWAYGSGGTSVVAVVQVTLDGGTNWRDVARFDFSTASAVKVANLSGLTAKGVTSYAALGSEGVLDGVLGNQMRVVLTSVGAFSNSTLSIRASLR